MNEVLIASNYYIPALIFGLFCGISGLIFVFRMLRKGDFARKKMFENIRKRKITIHFNQFGGED